MMTRFLLPAVLSVAALFAGGCATEPSLLTGKKSYYAYSWEQELELGANADKDITQQMGVYADDELSEYVRGVSQTVLDQSSMKSIGAPTLYQDTEFTFRVLDSPVVNAFALPGGFVYVTRGLLAHVENEAQLAVVIGHEITHVEARHASKQALKAQLGQLGLMAGAIIGEQVAENKELARQIVGLGGDLFQLVTLKYGRDAERESDLYGVEYAAKAGYEAGAGSDFFGTLKRLSEESGQSIPTWMSSHPDPGEREETVRRLASEWDQKLEMDELGRERYLQQIDGLIVGENPRNGYTENNTFYHPDLRFQFDTPPEWQVDNQTAAVYVVAPEGRAIVAFSLAPSSDPRSAAQAMQQRLNIELSYGQEEQVNGMPAYVIEGLAPTQSGGIPVFATFIDFGEHVVSFLGYASPQLFAAYKSAMRQTAFSFNELQNEQALQVQPYRLAIKPADRDAPFRDFLPERLPSGLNAESWAIMNQVSLDEPIEKGRLLKLPADQ